MKNFNPDKPFKEYEELIEIMKGRNIHFTDEKQAIDILKRIPYYHLINGYKDLFLHDENDNFLYPVNFYEFHILYLFNSEINSLIFKYIIAIEKALKSNISYIISKKYGIFTNLECHVSLEDRKLVLNMSDENDYLNKINYSNNKNSTAKRINTLNKIKREIISSISRNNSLSLCHYYYEHNHIPPWIITNAISFGLTILWYSILTYEDKDYVADNMFSVLTEDIITTFDKRSALNRSLTILRKYRNFIAHGNPVFTYSIKETLYFKEIRAFSQDNISRREYKKGIGKNDLYAVICIISSLLDGFRRRIFLQEVIDTLNTYNSFPYGNGQMLLQMLKLPDDLIIRLSKMI